MKILSFGSLNIDLVFQVPHFVSAGETLGTLSAAKFCGGKGLNQSVALAKAGAEVYHAGCVGTDGADLVDALKAAGVDTRFVKTTDGFSGTALIQVDKTGQNCILLHGGANRQITQVQMDETLSFFEAGDILLLQNEINDIDLLVEKAFAKGMKIALNPSPIDDSLKKIDLKKLHWLILNEIEGAALSGEENPDKVLGALQAIAPDAIILLTLGKAGSVCQTGETLHSQAIYPVEVVDTTAAGDTYTGYFLAAVCAGKSLAEGMQLASFASSIAVSRAGAAPSIPFLSEVLEGLGK